MERDVSRDMTVPGTMPGGRTPFVRRWWRRAYWFRRDLPGLVQLASSGPALYAGTGGLGDELMTTAIIRRLREDTGRPVTVFARHPALFEHNPDVGRILSADTSVLAAAQNWNIRLRRPFGWQAEPDPDRQAAPRDHLIAEKARAAGLAGRIELRPHLHLLASERQATHIPGDGAFVAIQSSGAAARWFYANKEWGAENFQRVIELLAPQLRLVQLGAADDPRLEGTIDRRALPLRESAALIAQSQGFIGQVGFLMHVARAVNKRAVIVFGGREHPSQGGYPCNENLYTPVACAPCWRKNGCDHGRECLTSIQPEQLIAAVERMLRRAGEPLETVFADL